ncbi:MAG TPA: HEAT repeat domain-containing protein [Solirubrobacteraceae bacterium]|nr:HEAT repeat domain-containing protein [Solirubrobacteraceae bacterium]
MNAPLPLLEALTALSGLLSVLAIATTACKVQRALRLRRHRRLEAAARPHVLRVLADDERSGSAPEMNHSLGRTFEELSISLLPKLRGADRDALVAALENRGVLERARRRTSRSGAVGRARAAQLLGDAGDEGALPGLARLLADRDPEVRTVAARALGKLGPTAVEPLLAALDSPRPVPAGIVTMALVHAGAAGADDLTQGLDLSRSARVRTVAAELLGQLGVLSATGRLAQTLADDPDLATRAAAARSLGRLGLPEGITPLLAALHEAQPSVLRIDAARALGRIGGASAVAALRELLVSPDIELARATAEGLAACGDAGVSALEAAAEAPVSAPSAREALARLTLSTSRRPAVAA